MAEILKAPKPNSCEAQRKRIDAERKARGLSWSQLAKEAHIPMASWMVSSKGQTIRKQDMEKLAAYFGVRYEWLRTGEEPKYPEEGGNDE